MTSASKTRLTNSPNPPVTSAATPSFREPRSIPRMPSTIPARPQRIVNAEMTPISRIEPERIASAPRTIPAMDQPATGQS